MPLFAACMMIAGVSASVAGSGSRAGSYDLDERTGGISTLRVRGGSGAAKSIETRYMVMSKSGDREAFERDDRVVERRKDRDGTVFRCENPKMPGIDIFKRYSVVNGGLRRTVSFLNANGETKYITPSVECRFAREFLDTAYHLGAGYIGPYKPSSVVEGNGSCRPKVRQGLLFPLSGEDRRYGGVPLVAFHHRTLPRTP